METVLCGKFLINYCVKIWFMIFFYILSIVGLDNFPPTLTRSKLIKHFIEFVRKGAPTTPLVTIAITKLVAEVLERNNLPGSIFTSFCGGSEIGQAIARDTRIPLVSFTGSSKVIWSLACVFFMRK